MEGFFGESCDDHGEDGEEDESPLRPAPAFAVDDEGTDDWSLEG